MPPPMANPPRANPESFNVSRRETPDLLLCGLVLMAVPFSSAVTDVWPWLPRLRQRGDVKEANAQPYRPRRGGVAYRALSHCALVGCRYRPPGALHVAQKIVPCAADFGLASSAAREFHRRVAPSIVSDVSEPPGRLQARLNRWQLAPGRC